MSEWGTKERRGGGNRRRLARYTRRRPEIYHRFDVDMRPTRKRRARRRGRLLPWLKVTAVLVSICSIGATARWVLRQTLYENRDFSLEEFVIRTDGVLSETEIAAATGLAYGTGLMGIDLEAVRTDLERLPLVEAAVVDRVLPGALEITISERSPYAWLAAPGEGIYPYDPTTGYLLDQEGNWFAAVGVGSIFDHLPVVRMKRFPRSRGGVNPEVRETITESLALIERSQEVFSDVDGVVLREISLRNPYSFTCLFRPDLEVVIGRRDTERALQDLRTILSHAAEAGKELASVNVMMARNIPVTYRDDRVATDMAAEAEGEADSENRGESPSAGAEEPARKPIRAKIVVLGEG